MRKRNRLNDSRLRTGLTLLEVILAVAIFAVSMVAIGELIRLGLRSAGLSRDQTTAQLLCESTLNEIVAGAILPEPVQRVPHLLATGWVYDIEVAQLDLENLLAVRVTTKQDRPDDVRVVSFSLVRWLPDPNMVLPETPTTDEAVSEAVDESSDAAAGAAGGAIGP